MNDATAILAGLVVLVPLAILWISALFHIIARRPDLSLPWKGAWSATVILLPFIGVMIYAAVRPPRPPKRTGTDDPSVVAAAMEQTRELVAAHDRGAIDDEEFAAGTARIFGLTRTAV